MRYGIGNRYQFISWQLIPHERQYLLNLCVYYNFPVTAFYFFHTYPFCAK